jgi:hypothetical protein
MCSILPFVGCGWRFFKFKNLVQAYEYIYIDEFEQPFKINL